MQNTDIREQYRRTQDFFNTASDLFNHRLFDNTLPQAQIVFEKLSKSKSKFVESAIADIRNGMPDADKIIINSTILASEEFILLMGALVDALTSQHQHYYGTAGRDGYRNKERAVMSKEIGLYPSKTGEVGGKEIGDGVDFYIITGSPFEQTLQELKAWGYEQTWQEIRPSPKDSVSQGGKRIKYICPHPDCKMNYLSGKNVIWECPDHKLLAIPQP